MIDLVGANESAYFNSMTYRRSGLRLRPDDPDSELLPLGGLTAQQESLRVLSFAADLERPKVLIPEPVRSIRLRFSPHLQLVEILYGDLALAQPIEQVVAERRRQIGPLDLRHLLTEGHAGQIFLDTPLFLRVAGMREAVGQVEETLPLLFPGFQAGLDKLGDDAVGARVARLHEGLHASGDTGGEADTLTDGLLDG